MESQTDIQKEEPKEYSPGKLSEYKSDFITGILLFAFGLFIVLQSVFNMPVPGLSFNFWYTAPGVFPAFLGSILMLTSALLFFNASKVLRKREKLNFSEIIKALKSNTTKRLALALLFFVVYIYLFIGKLNYILGTFIFLIVNMLIFDTKKRTIKRIILHFIISAVSSVFIAYIFGNFAKIPLP
jgi:hypothetical protein